MRKSIFIIAALFAATFANAQITKVGEVAGRLQVYTNSMTVGNVLYSRINQGTQISIKLYNLSGAYIQEYKTININKLAADNECQIEHLSKNYFTTDGKICFLYHEYSGMYPDFVVKKCQIIDEDGNVVYDIADKPFYEGSAVYNIGNIYYLVLEGLLSTDNSYIYALPGNGETSEDVATPSAPRHNARKYLHNDHILIENANHIYNLTGQEVK